MDDRWSEARLETAGKRAQRYCAPEHRSRSDKCCSPLVRGVGPPCASAALGPFDMHIAHLDIPYPQGLLVVPRPELFTDPPPPHTFMAMPHHHLLLPTQILPAIACQGWYRSNGLQQRGRGAGLEQKGLAMSSGLATVSAPAA